MNAGEQMADAGSFCGRRFFLLRSVAVVAIISRSARTAIRIIPEEYPLFKLMDASTKGFVHVDDLVQSVESLASKRTFRRDFREEETLSIELEVWRLRSIK